jgi:NCAIR mutase (PurE)-related protein
MSAHTQWIREILERLSSGQLDIDGALGELRDLPYENLGFARVDHHRGLRAGFPEVVLAQGKTVEQVAAIVQRLAAKNHNVLVTRATPDHAAAVLAAFPTATYDSVSRCLRIMQQPIETTGRGVVLVVSAGTADLPAAEEAAISAELMGNPVQRLYDVGVAGIHRLLDNVEQIRAASVVIVVAGMEGALPSVVGGLTGRPLIAVPTSAGYGASFGGVAALLGMLNSCAGGVTVVNIDNGFGAACAATRVNRREEAE